MKTVKEKKQPNWSYRKSLKIMEKKKHIEDYEGEKRAKLELQKIIEDCEEEKNPSQTRATENH